MRVYTLAFALLLCGCVANAATQQPVTESKQKVTTNTESVEFYDCMPAIHQGRDVDLPEVAALARSIANEIFFCEYAKGEPIEILGHILTVNGRPVHAGKGYVLADGSLASRRPIDLKDIAKQYLSKGSRIVVEERVLSADSLEDLRVYTVSGSYKYLVRRSIANIVTYEFQFDDREYTLVVWEQGARISPQSISEFFGTILRFIPLPDPGPQA